MQQYFAKDKDLNLEKSDYHHIKNVMRMKKGDLIKVVYDGICYDCELTAVSDVCKFKIVNKYQNKKENINITLAFSMIKEQKQNLMLQKATELGVNDFIPLKTKHSIINIESKKETAKIERWQKICKEASEQSFRTKVPKINNITNIKNITFDEYDLKIVCSLNKNAKNIKKVLQNKTKYDKIILIVGPEGGLASEEEDYLVSKGFVLTSLGDNVLRAETAPLVAISMINYELMR